jgi:hypothetical protein
MVKPQSIKKKRGKLDYIIYFLVLPLIVLLILVSTLTKVGSIPNYLNIGFLTPDNFTRCNTAVLPCELNNRKGDIIIRPMKPIIYLYPTTETNVKVKLEYKGEIFADYPKYDESIKGWNVKAYSDGKIIDNSDGKEYSYIFWEGNPSKEVNWDLSTGFVVKGEDTVEFLQNTLSKMGLTPKEYNEFIVYWYPKMKVNKYNLIHFAGEEYTNLAKLNVTPSPDSELRVFMVYKALDEKVDIGAQVIKPFERKGFSVIEWGGSEINK